MFQLILLLKKASRVGAFFLSAYFVAPVWAFCPLQVGLPQLPVQRVVDGDTLRLADGRSVRLIGINTPELAGRGRSAEPYAEAARRRLQALVAANGGRVGLQVGQRSKDRYGRTLAHSFDRQGRNLEAQLLAEGLGFNVAFEPATGFEHCQRTAERRARSQGVGLWRNAAVQSPGQLRSGGFALIRGQVQQVQRNRGGLWLEMGPLVLRVPAAQLKHFDGATLQRLQGRRVEVRGWVVDRSRQRSGRSGQARWLLTLTHSNMLDVLP